MARAFTALLMAALIAASALPAAAACLVPDPGLDSFAAGLPAEIASLMLPAETPRISRFCEKPANTRTPGAQQTRPPRAVTGPFLPAEVVIAAPGGEADVLGIAAAFNLALLEQYGSGLLNASVARLAIPDGRSVPAVLAALETDGRVSVSGPNHLFTLQGERSASLLPASLELDSLRGEATGKGVKVAVLDTAADATHPVLRGAIVGEFDGMPGIPVNDRSHGTAIAGLIAGREPMAGAAPEAELLIARIFDRTSDLRPQTHAYMILTALDWSAVNGAQIVNMSFAGPKNSLMSRAVEEAVKRGLTLIAAAGNAGPVAPYAYPAADEGVIAVTATDDDDGIYTRANRGRYVLVAAPGVDVLAPGPNGRANLMTGTSFSAAIVSGLAAMAKQVAPGADSRLFVNRLAETAIDLGPPGRDDIFGVGRVHASALIRRR